MKRHRILLAATVALTALTITAGATLGHAALQSSDPAMGATLKTPYTLTATYDDELTPNGSSIVVQNASGAQVAAGTLSATDDKQMTIDLPQLPDGQYTVLWTAVTVDDNGITRGTYNFTVAVQGAVSIPPSEQTPDPNASTTNNRDVVLSLALAVPIIVAIVGLVLYRNRRAQHP